MGREALDLAVSLTGKQQRFVEEYCGDSRLNATRAAKAAGYSEKTAYNIGWENVRKREVAAAIKDRLKEFSMSAEEAQERMSELARGGLEPFLGEDGKIDLTTEVAEANRHLLKKVRTSDTKYGETIDIEVHDQKDALKEILKLHGSYAQPEGGEVKFLIVGALEDVVPSTGDD